MIILVLRGRNSRLLPKTVIVCLLDSIVIAEADDNSQPIITDEGKKHVRIMLGDVVRVLEPKKTTLGLE